MDAKTRETLLRAIAKARSWIDGIKSGEFRSFDEIASREDLAERYVRRLAPLAYLSPKIVVAIASGVAPAELTVSGLTQKLPHSWAEQEHAFGLR